MAIETVAQRIADWVVGLSHEAVPPRVLDLARHQTMSVLAAMHAGADTEAARQVEAAVRREGASGGATALPSGEKLPRDSAVLLNSARSMALDYDDYLYMGHTGHSAVLAAIALGETTGASSRDVLVAQVAANEVGGRIGASCALGPQNGQAWSFIHAAEGAVIGARLLGLDRDQTAHAIAIALYQPTFTLWPGFMGPGSKVLTAAGPTIAGLQAADFAREGMTGALDIIEHPKKGLWSFFSFVPLRHMMTGLGRAWVGDTLTFKRYPGCAYVDTTLDALFDVLGQISAAKGRALQPDDVRSIDVAASLLSVEMERLSRGSRGERLSPININFSIGLNVGVGIVAGRHTAEEMRQAFLDTHEASIREIAGKTRLHHDLGMTLEVAKAFDSVLGEASVARSLEPRDYLAVIGGYRRQLGLDKSVVDGFRRALSPRAVLETARTVARSRRSRTRRPPEAPRERSLDHVDFERFRMAFPAEVTIELTDGSRFSARQDVPVGAPGQQGRLEAARSKLLLDAGRHQSPDAARRVVEAAASFEARGLDDFASLVCAP